MKPLYQAFSHAAYDAQGRLTSFDIDCPENFNFACDVVDRIAAEEPERAALVYCDETGFEKVISFGEMARLSSQAAGALQRRGVRRGDRVMLILKRHYEYWYTVLALHRLGAVAVPATHMLQTDDLIYRVKRIGISCVVCADDERLWDCLLKTQAQCASLRLLCTVRRSCEGFCRLDTDMQAETAPFPRAATSAKDPFILYFTSGTTGNPKPVTHNGYYPLAHIVTAHAWQRVQDGGLHLTVSDTGWGKASWGKIYGQWLCGCAVMVYDYERFSPENLLRILRKYRITSFCAPPTVYRFIVKNGFSGEDFASVKHVTTAGETLNPSIIAEFRRVTGLQICEGYGQTETALLVGNLAGDTVKVGSVGRPSPLFDVHIMREDGTLCAPDETGEIVVFPKHNGNPGLCISCGSESDRARAWINGVYHTGDLARADADGCYWYIGRKDDVIKSSGYRIGPFEIENVLIQHPAVQECAVTGVPDAERGCVVKATVVLCSGFAASKRLAGELQQFVKEKTAPYKYPRIVEFTRALPKTISGKIRRAELRRQGC